MGFRFLDTKLPLVCAEVTRANNFGLQEQSVNTVDFLFPQKDFFLIK